jgi:hypothetical protein
MKIREGDTVKLKDTVKNHTCPKGRRNHRTAVVRFRLDDYAKGALRMARDLRGCLYWNEEDVEKVGG